MKVTHRRIMIALDPAAPRPDALLALKAFADGSLELTGVFIENADLQRLASLPVAREVRLTTSQSDRLDEHSLRQQFDACARAVEQALREAQRTLQTRVRFQVLRGNVLKELQRAAAEMDWLIIGRSLRSAGARTWLGATPERIASVIAEGPAPVNLLFVHEPWATGGHVLWLDDGSAAAARARDQAMLIAAADRLPLQAATLAAEPATATTHDDAMDAVTIDSLRALRRQCEHDEPRVIVLPDTEAIRQSIDFEALLADLPASVAIVR